MQPLAPELGSAVGQVRGNVWTSLALASAMAIALGVTMCARSVRPREPVSEAPERRPAEVPEPDGHPAPEVATAASEPVALGNARALVGNSAAEPLDRLLGDLHALKTGERSEPVRIVWLGDSHTAADFCSQVVRTGLQREFGDGGPGLIHVGLKAHRHGQVRSTVLGSWRSIPAAPASFQSQDEGVFGLGGVGTSPSDTRASARVELRAAPGPERALLTWRLAYRLPTAGSRFQVQLGAQTHAVEVMRDVSRGGIGHVEFQAPLGSALLIRDGVGGPELFGVVAENGTPGVVVDALGINGARVLTAVSWDREAWIAELEQRRPSLLILAYGANEVGDGQAPWRYAEAYREMLARAQAAAPEVGCLILGTSERALPDWTTNPRVLQIEEVQRGVAQELGCSFFSVIEAMGGPGSLRAWAFAKPPLAAKDRIHLTPSGYRLVGEQLLQALLDSYAQRFSGQ